MKIKYGEHYIWKHILKGGYGYIHYINATIIKIGKRKVKIEVLKNDGFFKQIWINPENLIRK